MNPSARTETHLRPTQLTATYRDAPIILLPSVASILNQLGPLPPYRLLAGVDEDGRPVLLNLSAPGRAPVLIAGDAGSGKTHLLHTLVEAALRLHSPEDVRVMVLSRCLDEWVDLAGSSATHFDRLVRIDRPAAGRTILELSALIERRLNGGDGGGPAYVVAIDDFIPLLSAGFDTQLQLRGLFELGPRARIWPLVTVATQQALNLHYWIDPFRTRILGKMDAPAAQALGIHPGLAPRGQFCAWTGVEWVHFWAPNA